MLGDGLELHYQRFCPQARASCRGAISHGRVEPATFWSHSPGLTTAGGMKPRGKMLGCNAQGTMRTLLPTPAWRGRRDGSSRSQRSGRPCWRRRPRGLSVSSALCRVSTPGQVAMELLCAFRAARVSTALRSLLPPQPDPSAGAAGHVTVLCFFLVAPLRGVSVGFPSFAEGSLKLSSVPLKCWSSISTGLGT